MNKLLKLTLILPYIFLAAACGGHDEHDHGHDHDHDHDMVKEEHDHDHEHDEADEHEHGHDECIKLTPNQIKEFGIKIDKVLPNSFSEVIKVSGRIEPAATDRMIVTARRSGIFRLTPGITAGSHVNAGQLIGTISAKGVQGGNAGAAAQSAVTAAKRELDRVTPLYHEGLVTASVYNEAQRAYNEALALAAGAPGGSGSETAPCAGVVTDIYVSSGQYVEVGTQIACVSRNTQLTLRADVPEKYVGAIPSITTANFRPDYTPTTFSLKQLGGVRLSASSSAASNGYIPLRFKFNSNGEVVPGAYAEIFLIGAPRTGVISLPRTAIVEAQGNKYVYVKTHDNHFEKRIVTTGATDGVRVEILSGLKQGEDVATQGASVVRMAETSAIAPPGHSHNH